MLGGKFWRFIMLKFAFCFLQGGEMDKVIITGNTLTLDEVAAVCRNYEKVELSELAVEKILK